MSIVCAFDQTVHETTDALHEHLKRFRVSRAKYYTTYEPRLDPVTKELIPFKDLDQYRNQDFASKVTMKKWLKDNPEAGWEWAKGFLAKRKEQKGLVYAPSQAELRTLCCPSIPYYNTMGVNEGGYYGVARALGYQDRYHITSPTFASLPPSTIITQDTREQNPIRFPEYQTIIGTLSVGDYAVSPVNNRGIHIERKSLSDFCGTMSGRKVERKKGEDSAYQRFARELERAQSLGIYIVMIVESSITDAQRFDYLPQTRWIKASPAYIFHNLRDLLTQFPLVWQVLFVNGRTEMARAMVKVFQMGEQVKGCDLQLAYEEGKLL